MLKLYREKGMILTKVHRILKFNQSEWLKPYIDFNTIQRATHKFKSEKDFFKLMNNSFYGKTVENIRNYQDIHLINTNEPNAEKRIIRYQSKPNFVNTVSFSETLKAVKMEKKTMYFNKPTYVGVAVLE